MSLGKSGRKKIVLDESMRDIEETVVADGGYEFFLND